MSDTEGKVSILIVDDRPEKLLALEAVLEDLGQNIVRAYNGREALRHVLLQEFAVILLDVNMPGMDGFETAQLIRQRKSSAHVPIIFLTAMGDELHVARGYELGAVDYILTPVVPQVLRSKVAVFVDLFRKTQQIRLQADRLRQRATQLHRLTGASLAINSASSVDRIAKVAVDKAREVIGAHQAVIVLNPGPYSTQVVCHGSYSEKYPAWRTVPPQIERQPGYGLAVSANKVVRMTPPELDAHAPVNPDPAAGPLFRGLLACPLNGREGTRMGLIILSEKIDGEFTDDDQAVLVQLSQMASVAVENTVFAEERESNRLKNEFLSTLSHELRTPLNAISGWVQLLKMKPINGEIGHGLDVLERNVRAQTKLIEDLLDLSRISTGKLRLNLRAMQLRPVVESTVETLRPAIEERRISLHCRIDAGESTVCGDPDRLQQVIWNLLNNAAKFTSAGGEISVRLQICGDSLRLSVTDSGEGIDPEFLPFVFDRFRQADSTSSRRHGGLGIGLTIVRHIMTLHHGTVAAESAGRGRGATFSVTLPLAVNRGVDAPPPKSEEQDAPIPSLDGIRVLLVDDEPDAREVVAEILARHEAIVTTAASAAEALELLTRSCPDVLVSDLAMPEQDGFALLDAVRRHPDKQARRLPMLALTAYARPEDKDRVLQAGFAAHLPKPVDPAELVRAVYRCAAESPRPRRDDETLDELDEEASDQMPRVA